VWFLQITKLSGKTWIIIINNNRNETVGHHLKVPSLISKNSHKMHDDTTEFVFFCFNTPCLPKLIDNRTTKTAAMSFFQLTSLSSNQQHESIKQITDAN